MVLIADEVGLELKKAISSKGIPTEALFEQKLAAVDSVMSAFVLKQHGRYSVYIASF